MKRYTITQFRNDYPDDDACLDKLYRLRFEGLICPKCDSDKPFSKVKDRRSYQCPVCSFQVYPTQGTVFEKTTTPLSFWFYAIFLQTTTRNGVAAKELERQLSICYKTALRIAHQIKKLMANPEELRLDGIVEMDETYVGARGRAKHQSYTARKDRRDKKRVTKFDKAIVIGAVQRNGSVYTMVVPNIRRDSLLPFVYRNISRSSTIVTDEYSLYKSLKYNYKHEYLNHKSLEYIRGEFHTNTIEGYWSLLKRTIKGTHIHVSRQHLQKYIDEVSFRYAYKNHQDVMFEAILRRVAA